MASTRLSHRGASRSRFWSVLYGLLGKVLADETGRSLSRARVLLEESAERIVGDLPVVARLSMGHERLTLFFTDRRIIVGRRGKSSAGSVPATFMLGSLGSALSGFFHRGTRRSSKPGSRYPNPNTILGSNRDNFSIYFDDVVGVDLTRTPSTNTIVILSKNDKLTFSCGTRMEEIQRLFKAKLENRLSISKTGLS